MTTVTSATSTAAAVNEGATSKLNADFDMFLKLLTAQMQNQDPLDPMDTSQYTQQLVQYSQVEQSIEQTGTLKSILASLGTQNLTQASALIGRPVETNSAAAGLSSSAPAQWIWTAPRAVTSITAEISDKSGRLIDTRTIEASGTTGSVAWNGKTATGRQYDPGTYTIKLVGIDASGAKVTLTPHAVGLADDVYLENNNIYVTVNGLKVLASDLVRVSTASAGGGTGTGTGSGSGSGTGTDTGEKPTEPATGG